MSPKKKKSYLKFVILLVLNCIMLILMGRNWNKVGDQPSAKENFEEQADELEEFSFI